MIPCTILDLPDLYEILSGFLGSSDALHWSLKNALVSGSTKFFLQDGAVVSYDNLGHGKYLVHIYSVSRDMRGMELRNFAVKAGRWMLDNTDAKVFLTFIKNDRLDLKFFMRMIGSRRFGGIPGSDEILYVSTGDMGIKEV
jgi:hypothetical protein